jgi:hypothetical protein
MDEPSDTPLHDGAANIPTRAASHASDRLRARLEIQQLGRGRDNRHYYESGGGGSSGVETGVASFPSSDLLAWISTR